MAFKIHFRLHLQIQFHLFGPKHHPALVNPASKHYFFSPLASSSLKTPANCHFGILCSSYVPAMTDDDTHMRHRLLLDGDGAGDDRRINIIIKQANKFAQANTKGEGDGTSSKGQLCSKFQEGTKINLCQPTRRWQAS